MNIYSDQKKQKKQQKKPKCEVAHTPHQSDKKQIKKTNVKLPPPPTTGKYKIKIKMKQIPKKPQGLLTVYRHTKK